MQQKKQVVREDAHGYHGIVGTDGNTSSIIQDHFTVVVLHNQALSVIIEPPANH